jgi:hypothetical protein
MDKRFGIIALCALFACGVALIAALVISGDANDSKSLLLPVLAISSVCLLLAALSVVSVAFNAFGLSDPKQALGLPEGSVRAVIAISLVVLFTIMAVYLFHGVSKDSIETMKDIPISKKDEIIADLQKTNKYIIDVPDKDGTTDRIYVRRGPTPEAVDIAKQLIILLGTLVTSVSSFYFGTRAAAQPGTAPVVSEQPQKTS